ncbi:hypothetical protein D9M68_888080 [compost metagenome]
MHTENWLYKEGDVLTLRVLEGINDAELLRLLKTEGIEIYVNSIKENSAQIIIRAPKRMMALLEQKNQHTK